MDDYPFLHAPEIDRAAFVAILTAAGSPAAPSASALYDLLARRGASPLFFLGFFFVESKFGREGICARYGTRSPGNVRSVEDPASGGWTISDPAQGAYAAYPSWWAGTNDWIDRLLGPKYAGAGLTTLKQILPKYAPKTDSNDPVAYANSVLAALAGWLPQESTPVSAPEILDVRALLPTNTTGGRADKKGPKSGIIVHYSGPAVNRQADTLAILQEYARFHMGPYLGERGIAYHYDIGNDGRIRQCRDADAILWHCGSWPENSDWYAVHVMIGDGQRATPAQLQALGQLCLYLSARDGFSDNNVKGHQEVSATSCPGSLMGDFVLPWRAGTFPLVAATAQEAAPVSNYYKFPETGKGIQNGFKEYWESQGGLRHFGLPLTDEIRERCEDGVERTVQYFERSVFEWHPDAPAGYTIQERRVGAILAKQAGLRGPGIG